MTNYFINSLIKTTLKTYSIVMISGMALALLLWSSCAYAKKYYATIVTDGNDLHDNALNQSAYDGFLMAQTTYGIKINYLQSKTKADYIPNLNKATQDGSDLIFGVGYMISQAIIKTAKEYPANNFVLIGYDTSKMQLPNLTGITYDIEQASYLAGVLAANLTYKYSKNSPKLNNKKVLGIVVGMKSPGVDAYVAGYIAGIKSVDKKITILISRVNSLSDMKKTAKVTEAMIKQGADIILPVAGHSGLGAIYMAKKHNVLIIGADKDQNIIAPSTVLVSIEKDVTNSVYDMIKTDIKGKKLPSYLHLGLKSGGVKLSRFHQFENIIPKELKTELYRAERLIKNSSLIIPKTMDKALDY